ncbi:shikimate dehydrogenase [Candidatus Marsarchaeota archaeon]|nr:shikimate dehydrogenase [Candidatus Marsarchaeota archaeon]
MPNCKRDKIKINVSGNKTGLYCIIGMPAHHSLSPAIQNSGFNAKSIDAVFLAFDVDAKDLGNAIKGIKAYGIKGMTLTSPHKEKAIKLVDKIDKFAKALGAVNTVVNKNNILYGYNTDAIGFINALKSQKISLKSKNISIIGAGGAARAFAFSLIYFARVSKINVVNRTLEHANQLKHDAERHFAGKKISTYKLYSKQAEAILAGSDIIINATNITLENDRFTPVPKRILNKNMVVFDANYSPLNNRLIKEANEAGCKTISGIELLVFQGIAAFNLFTNQKISYKIMKEAASAAIKNK